MCMLEERFRKEVMSTSIEQGRPPGDRRLACRIEIVAYSIH